MNILTSYLTSLDIKVVVIQSSENWNSCNVSLWQAMAKYLLNLSLTAL